MTPEEEYYNEIGRQLKDVEPSQMFGKPCLKTSNKAFACFFQNEMVFKLNGNTHDEALSLDGSKLFDPSGKNRPMKEWVQVAYHYKDQWTKLAKEAKNYVDSK